MDTRVGRGLDLGGSIEEVYHIDHKGHRSLVIEEWATETTYCTAQSTPEVELLRDTYRT